MSVLTAAELAGSLSQGSDNLPFDLGSGFRVSGLGFKVRVSHGNVPVSQQYILHPPYRRWNEDYMPCFKVCQTESRNFWKPYIAGCQRITLGP